MTICANCWGKCDVSEIEMFDVETEWGDYLVCPKCDSVFKLQEVDMFEESDGEITDWREQIVNKKKDDAQVGSDVGGQYE